MSSDPVDIFQQLPKYTRGMNILYVEDEAEVRTDFKKVLERFFQQVDTATNGLEGFNKYQEKKYDIVLADVSMPIMNGIEMIERIKSIHPSQKIMVLTAFEESDDLVKLINLGVSKFVRKPIKSHLFFEQLLEVASALYNVKKVEELYIKLEQKSKLSTTLLEQYKYAVDAATIVSKTNHKGIINYANDAFCKISGYQLTELIGQPHNIVRSPNSSSEVFRQLWSTIQSKNVWQGILENRAKAGNLYTVNATILPILDPEDNIIEYICIRQDITELKRLQLEELSQSVEKAREIQWGEIIQSLPTATVILNLESKVIYKNKLFNSLTNYSIDAAVPIETYFIHSDKCTCKHSSIDWKECLINLGIENAPRLFLNVSPEPVEVQIFMKCITANKLYIASFIPIDFIEILG